MKMFEDQMLHGIEDLMDLVMKEHTKQLVKWGTQSCSGFEWLTYTAEELGELAEAISEHEYREGKRIKVVDEAIQLATLALKIAEMYSGE